MAKSKIYLLDRSTSQWPAIMSLIFCTDLNWIYLQYGHIFVCTFYFNKIVSSRIF